MTDKERIERLIQTLMHLKNCMDIIKKNYGDPLLHKDIDKVRDMIELVVQRNADQVEIPDIT